MTDVGRENPVAWRKALGYIAGAVMLFVGATSASAADLLGNSGTVTDHITSFADQARAAGGSAPSVANPVTAAPLKKFSANGRLTESLGSGPCANNVALLGTCSGCSFITMTGQVNATVLGKSFLNACFTLLASSGSGASLGSGLGIGTLTTANGNVVNISFAGNLDINDENISTVTLFLSMNLAYLVEGGTGPFLTETGTGNISVTDIIVNPGSPPIPGTGAISINGHLSKN
jgi:hypothetical protein